MDGKILCNGTYYYAAVKTFCILRMLRIIIIIIIIVVVITVIFAIIVIIIRQWTVNIQKMV